MHTGEDAAGDVYAAGKTTSQGHQTGAALTSPSRKRKADQYDGECSGPPGGWLCSSGALAVTSWETH